MKLQKQLSRRVGAKEYPKWVIAIPPKLINALGWNEGQSLESKVLGNQLLIELVNQDTITKRKEAAFKAWRKRRTSE